MCSERAGQDRGKLLLFCVLFWCSLFSVLRVMEQWNAGRCRAVIASTASATVMSAAASRVLS